jgi:hypothetical protein
MESKRTFSKSLFKKKRSRFTQHNQARNITAMYFSLQNDKTHCNISMISLTLFFQGGDLFLIRQ